MPCHIRELVPLAFAEMLGLIDAHTSWLHPLRGSQEFCDVHMRQSRGWSWCCWYSSRRTGDHWGGRGNGKATIVPEYRHKRLRSDRLHRASTWRCIHYSLDMEMVLLDVSFMFRPH